MDATSHPFASVIVPTYGRPRPLLELCLPALARQSYPADRLEVLVVDDGSPVPLVEADLRATGVPNLRLLRQHNQGPAAARNTGGAAARGDILAFTDDDCAPEPDWVARLVQRLRQDGNTAVGGRTINALPHNPYAEASQLLVDYLYEYFSAVPDRGHFFTSNNVAFPASRFRELGGFDARYPLAAAEDRDICDRWREAGLQLVVEPQAVVRHHHGMTFVRYWRQQFNYGRGAFHYRRARAARHAGPMRVEPPAFYLRLLAYPFRRQNPLAASRTTLLLALSQAANVAGFAREGRLSQRPAATR